MPLSTYDGSVALFVRGLRNVKSLVKKAEAHATANALAPRALLDARLAGDMQGLGAQLHWATEGARLAVARLLGDASAPPSPEGQTFEEIGARLDAAIAWLEAVPRDALEPAMSRTISMDHRGKTTTFTGDEYLLKFAIPNFYFHFATAYAILRQSGVALMKGDFMGELFR